MTSISSPLSTDKRAFAFMILNGSMDDAVIIPYFDGLVKQGYQGVCLHPRDGLLLPYGSRLFWERMERIAGLALERELAVWFYDEFTYPSGAAGGIIPELYPEARVRNLLFEEVAPQPDSNGLIHLGAGPLLALLRYTPGEDGAMANLRDVTPDTGPHCDTWVWGEWQNKYYTAALHVREEKHERASAERFGWTYLPTTPLNDDRLLAIRQHTPGGKKGWAGMPDITLPEVTDLFLDKIYKPYAEMAKRLGLKDVPIFQDEVSAYTALPWNREIEQRLRPIWGEDIYLKMAALHSTKVEGWEQTRYEYRQATGDALEKNWFERVTTYCRANGLRMTGHLPGEESIMGHCHLMGNAFNTLRHFDIPGYDIISSPTADDVNRCQAIGAKLVQSAAWWAGRKEVMAEVFGAHGFHHDLQTARTETAWLAAHDIEFLADHGAWVSTHSLRKYDAPPVWNRFNPLSAGHAALWNWHGWFCDVLKEYAFTPDTLILFPVESFARFSLFEQSLWYDEVSLLETFYHYACAHSLDCLFVPSELLSKIQTDSHGFHLQGQTFKRLIVPPVQSLQKDTWAALTRLKMHEGFSWIQPDGKTNITVFDSTGSRLEIIEAWQTAACSEDILVREKAAWFDTIFAEPSLPFRSDVSIVQSRRRSADGKELLVIINPNQDEVELRCERYPGALIQQPPFGNSLKLEEAQNGWILRLPARDIALLHLDVTSPPDASSQAQPIEIRALHLRQRIIGANHFSLKEGSLFFEDHGALPFVPQPVSSSWQLPLRYEGVLEERDWPYAPSFSLEELAHTKKLTAQFPIQLEEDLSELILVLDEESMPPQTEVWWDKTILQPELRNVYEQGNTVFVIPAKLLLSGQHELRFVSVITNASQGILERPILTGGFSVMHESPLKIGALKTGWQDVDRLQPWPELGLPEAFGPVEYSLTYPLIDADAAKTWNLVLPAFVGVAEVRANGIECGISAWEPRLIPVPPDSLKVGDNEVVVRLHGSWNNLFSRLNHLANGLAETPVLRSL